MTRWRASKSESVVAAEKALVEGEQAAAVTSNGAVEEDAVAHSGSNSDVIPAHAGGSVAAKLALQYHSEMKIMEQMLSESGVQLPRHFTHAQLMRFAIPHGLMQVR